MNSESALNICIETDFVWILLWRKLFEEILVV